MNRILKEVRTRIAEFYEKESIFEEGEIDESYFEARRIIIRGRGSYRKTIVFGSKEKVKFILNKT